MRHHLAESPLGDAFNFKRVNKLVGNGRLGIIKVVFYAKINYFCNMNQFGIATDYPVDVRVLQAEMGQYKAPSMKIQRLAKQGDLIRLRRNLYLIPDERPVNTFLVANSILAPSYVSGLSALWYYGVIPEFVYEVISMTTKRSTVYLNPLGTFRYVSLPLDYYQAGIVMEPIDGRDVFFASKEKALCDYIYMTHGLNLRYTGEILRWMEDEMRFDMDIIASMDLSVLRQCAIFGHKRQMIEKIANIISHG